MISNVEPLLKKLHKAVLAHEIPKRYTTSEKLAAAESSGVLSSDEVKILQNYEQLKNEIIKVNEFSFDLETVIA